MRPPPRTHQEGVCHACRRRCVIVIVIVIPQGYTEVYGKRHTKTAACMSNLGSMYRNSKRYDEAQEVYRAVLQIYQVRPRHA